MSDVLTIEDLQAAKKHDTFHNEVITGKVGGVSGGANIDTATNAVTSQTQKTMPKIMGDAESAFNTQLAAQQAEFITQLQAQGWNPVAGSFETGGTIVNRRDILWWEAAKSWYSWQGTLPNVVAAGSTPATSGGVSPTAWVDRTDGALRSELISQDGSSKVGFKQAGTGAVTTNVQSKLLEFVSVKDFGAVGDGVVNDTAAINAALLAVNALGKVELYFPAGVYRYAGGGWLGNGVVITGAGRNATTIRSIQATPVDGYLFDCRGVGSGIRSMRFDATGTTQTGGSYVWLKAPESFIDDFHMTGDYNGILMTGNASRIRHGRFQDGAVGATRIRAEGGDNSQLIDDVLMGAQTPQVSSAGIRVRNSSALIISNTSVIQQGHGLLVDPFSNAVGTNTVNTDSGSVFSLYVNNCFFDNASGNGVRIAPTGTASVVRCRFSNCWIGSSAGDGVFIVNAGSGKLQGMYFDSCHAVLNGTDGFGAGFTTGGTVTDASINGGIIANNTIGVYFNGTTNSKVSNATIGAGGGLSGNTVNGIVLASGTSNIVVTGNTVVSNTANGIVALGTAVGYVIADNFISGNGANLAVNSTANRVVRNNVGVTSPDFASGNSLVTTGATSVVVTHGLGVAPNAASIQISPTTGWESNPLFVDTTTITSTQFTVRAASAVSTDYTFAWSARINNN